MKTLIDTNHYTMMIELVTIARQKLIEVEGQIRPRPPTYRPHSPIDIERARQDLVAIIQWLDKALIPWDCDPAVAILAPAKKEKP